jgi:phenylacetate-CoA ligase
MPSQFLGETQMNYFDEATETLPREQLAALQLGKLQAMMAELWGRNGFYTAKWKAAGVSPATSAASTT